MNQEHKNKGNQMEKNKSTPVPGSLLPSEIREPGGVFFEGGRATCVKAVFAPHKWPGRSAIDFNKEGDKRPEVYHARLNMGLYLHPADPDEEFDAEKPTSYYSCGSLMRWRPSKDGYTPCDVDCGTSWLLLDTEQERRSSEGVFYCEVDEDEQAIRGEDGELLDPDAFSAQTFHPESGIMEFFGKCVQGGLTEERMNEFRSPGRAVSLKCLVGIDGEWERVIKSPRKNQKTGKIEVPTKDDGEPVTVLVLTKLYGIVDVADFENNGGSDKKPVDSAEIEGEIEKEMVVFLTENGGSETVAKFRPLCTKKGANTKQALTLVSKKSLWLRSDDRPWIYDSGEDTATLK